MRWLTNSSVRTKVTAVVVGVSASAVMLMGAAYGVVGYERTRGALVREVQALARVSAGSLAAPALFNDASAAHATLAALAKEPDVAAARVVMPDGRVLAHAPRDQGTVWRIEASGKRIKFLDTAAEVVHPIRRDGRRVASLHLKVSLTRLEESQNTLLLIGLGVVAGAIAVAVALARPLCGYLIWPVEELARAVEWVRRTRDFSVRVPSRAQDEIGELVTGFNEMLDQIHSYSTHMEDLIEQRTHDLAESNEELRKTIDALEDAKREAEASDAAKTRFLANMSHELRTPLNAILGFAEMLQYEVFGPLGHAKYREYTGDIHASATHLLDVISDVLDVARLESGRFSLAEDSTTVGTLCGETERMLSVTAEHRGIALSCDVGGEAETTLACDPARMRQVLLNLVANALKFTPQGGSVRVSAARDEQGGLRLSVRDTGCGMDPADVPRILEPFGQVASPYAREHQGTGLGLALCKQIVEMHGGTLSVDTLPNAGTTVTARVPPERVGGSPDVAAASAQSAG